MTDDGSVISLNWAIVHGPVIGLGRGTTQQVCFTYI